MSEKFIKKDLKRSIRVLKCIYAWNGRLSSLFCIKTKTVCVWRNQPSVPCFKPLNMCLVAPQLSLLDCTCRMLICRKRLLSEEISFDCGAKGQLLTLKDKHITNKHISRERGSTQRVDRGGGVLSYKRLMGMWRSMGSHFHDWIDYNGVAFSSF